MDKKSLTERDICTKFVAPAIQLAGWDIQKQVREEVSFTKGRIIVRGKLHSRGESRRANFVLYHQANLPIAVIEAKDNKHDIGSGMRQALGYAESLDVPFVFSINGDGFLIHDRTGTGTQVETELSLDQFPSLTSCGSDIAWILKSKLQPLEGCHYATNGVIKILS
jgi:type I restriction enzyme R subunit